MHGECGPRRLGKRELKPECQQVSFRQLWPPSSRDGEGASQPGVLWPGTSTKLEWMPCTPVNRPKFLAQVGPGVIRRKVFSFAVRAALGVLSAELNNRAVNRAILQPTRIVPRNFGKHLASDEE